MKTQIEGISKLLADSLHGTPWFGRSAIELLEEIDPAQVWIKPCSTSHSMIELLYHMQTWASFTLNRLQKIQENDPSAIEKLDWRDLEPQTHGWEEGLSEFVATNQELIALLNTQEDELLDEKVDYRDYNFRHLLHGYVQHNIYHVGQIVALSKIHLR